MSGLFHRTKNESTWELLEMLIQHIVGVYSIEFSRENVSQHATVANDMDTQGGNFFSCDFIPVIRLPHVPHQTVLV